MSAKVEILKGSKKYCLCQTHLATLIFAVSGVFGKRITSSAELIVVGRGFLAFVALSLLMMRWEKTMDECQYQTSTFVFIYLLVVGDTLADFFLGLKQVVSPLACSVLSLSPHSLT